MKITNNHKLPPEYVQAVEANEHPRDYYSPSMLTNPPRMVHLVRRYYKDITIDAVDRLWSLFGTAVHDKLEKQNAGGLSEIELCGDFHGWKLKGRADLLSIYNVIRDWKVTSVYAVIKDPTFDKYKYQLNAYKRLLEKNGYKVEGMEVTAILKDWKERESHKSDYPTLPIHNVTIEPIADINDWIADRIELFEDTKSLYDDDLPYCTKDEKWQDPHKYAVMMKGKKKALKLHIDKDEAIKHAEKVGGYLEDRPSIPRRCEKYCDAREFCNQYKEERLQSMEKRA